MGECKQERGVSRSNNYNYYTYNYMCCAVQSALLFVRKTNWIVFGYSMGVRRTLTVMPTPTLTQGMTPNANHMQHGSTKKRVRRRHAPHTGGYIEHACSQTHAEHNGSARPRPGPPRQEQADNGSHHQNHETSGGQTQKRRLGRKSNADVHTAREQAPDAATETRAARQPRPGPVDIRATST